MANITRRSNGSYEIRFFSQPNKRRSFYPGRKATKKQAESIASKLEQLAFAAGQSETPPLEVAAWLSTLSDRQHAKLAGWGLVQPRSAQKKSATEKPKSLDDWLQHYLQRRRTWKPSTLEQKQRAADNLTEFFGRDKPIATITPGDAEDFRIWLQTKAKHVAEGEEPAGLAHNTVRRRIGRAKEMFASAVKHKVIDENPFSDEVSATGANIENHRFIPAEWIERLIRIAPCEDWRIILAFGRYAGMRSHETRLQRWEDIDIPNRRMTVRSNKTPPVRSCPILPDLLPHLMRAKEMAPQGAELVVSRYTPNANILTTLYKLIDKAGLERWPDAMQNLRRSRETELMAEYPIKDVAGWIGNSVPVAMKHYAMAMEDSFTRAVLNGIGGVKSFSRQISRQSASISDDLTESNESEEREEPQEKSPLRIPAEASSCPTRT